MIKKITERKENNKRGDLTPPTPPKKKSTTGCQEHRMLTHCQTMVAAQQINTDRATIRLLFY